MQNENEKQKGGRGGNEGDRGSMTVEEAGRRGGEKTSETHGPDFYSDIGQKGGQRVRELIEEGKRNKDQSGGSQGESNE